MSTDKKTSSKRQGEGNGVPKPTDGQESGQVFNVRKQALNSNDEKILIRYVEDKIACVQKLEGHLYKLINDIGVLEHSLRELVLENEDPNLIFRRVN